MTSGKESKTLFFLPSFYPPCVVGFFSFLFFGGGFLPTKMEKILMLSFHQPAKPKPFQGCMLEVQLDKKPRTVKFQKQAARFCWRHHCLMEEIRSMSVIMFKSNPLNLAVAYNYFSAHCGTKNGLIFPLWSISCDAARLTLTLGCDTAFLMPLTILNDIDNKARQDKPLRQQAGFFFQPFFFIYSCSNSFSQPWTWI